MSRHLYIGLMSGTSLDGLDIALVNFETKQPVLLAQKLAPYPKALLKQLKDLCRLQTTSFNKLGSLDIILGDFYADAVLGFMRDNDIRTSDVIAIGSHGQTIHHEPNGTAPFTLQIGDANRIAEKTGITVVADFRKRDMAAGGQGAPLVPAFHAACFQNAEQNRAIVNIGGIANITFLPKNNSHDIIGFDSGPGNTLMDQICQQHFNQHYDENAALAKTGTVNQVLLATLLDDEYFKLPYPKSTGPEYFSTEWLASYTSAHATNPQDTLATLCTLSALTIAHALKQLPNCSSVYICGGGVHNPVLMDALKKHIEGSVETTDIIGVDPDWVEAMAFAWLAKQTLDGKPGNIPSVTGANKAVILGAIYPA